MNFVDLLKKYWALILILLLSSFVRFYNLSFSHFYGDETKTLYLDKTIPASQFLMDQRKGPVQFLIVWFTEKVFGGYDEFYTRLPFAICGISAILAFYLLVEKLFDKKAALLASALFAVSGFNIAFSRTAQYQSVLMLFGFLFLYFFYTSLLNSNLKKLLISALFFGLALLTHYDAIFFGIFAVVLYLSSYKSVGFKFKDLFIYFVLPIILITGIFYIPYLTSGMFSENTFNYLQRRFSGKDYSVNSSFYTFEIYNPFLPYLLILLFSSFAAVFSSDHKVKSILFWFFAAFMFFEFFVLNPGTHILNYYIPLYILAGYFISKYKLSAFAVPFILISFFVNTLIFTNISKSEYPWVSSKIGPLTLKQANKNYNLFLYGFSYNRGWDQIRDYFATLEGVRGVYTNDNDIIAKHYLRKFDYTIPGSNFLPQYYIYVYKNQEILNHKPEFGESIMNYTELRSFYVNGEKTATVYKLVK